LKEIVDSELAIHSPEHDLTCDKEWIPREKRILLSLIFGFETVYRGEASKKVTLMSTSALNISFE